MSCSKYCIHLNTMGECNLNGRIEMEHCFKHLKDEHDFRKSGMRGYRNKAREYRLAAEEWMKKYDELKTYIKTGKPSEQKRIKWK